MSPVVEYLIYPMPQHFIAFYLFHKDGETKEKKLKLVRHIGQVEVLQNESPL